MDQVTNNIDVRTDFVEIYARAILEDLGVELKDNDQSDKLVKMAADRITARLYLEIIAMLTPEQASMVAEDLSNQNPDPESNLNKIIKTIPGFAPRLAQVMAKVRSELLEDLKPLV